MTNNTSSEGVNTGYRICWGSSLDIAYSAILKDELLKALESKQDCYIDAANVSRVDTASLQVLAAFVRDLETQGSKLVWQGDSEVIRQGAGLLGLEQILRL
ncbi:MAG: STAS domain-containing protein [Gammaproteobacteria bacterium]|nr:STAS domain-containing protein [Gammaproteobacteria bacterium]MDH5802658.1 STAS domain-containing protein [Gammaproteobacteria bacterium]